MSRRETVGDDVDLPDPGPRRSSYTLGVDGPEGDQDTAAAELPGPGGVPPEQANV